MPRNIISLIKASLPNVQQTIKYISQYRLENQETPYDKELYLVVLYLKNNNIDEATRVMNNIIT